MSMLSKDEAKLKWFGLLAADIDTQARDYAQSLGIPVPTLAAWKSEFKKIDKDSKVDALVNAEEVVVERVAREVAKEMTKATPMPEHLEIDELTGEVMTMSKLQALQEQREREAMEREEKLVTGFKESIHGLQALKQQSQVVAATLLNNIAKRLEDHEELEDLSIKDTSLLASSLSSLHSAFFNKPTTNIQVNQNNTNTTALSAFREKLKS